MKKIISMALVCVLLMSCVLTLASCSNVSESYAKKVQKAADSGEHYTLAQVKEDLGDEAIEIVIGGFGVVVAVKGCTSLDEIKEKMSAEEDVEGIVIGIALNKATSASYKKITEKDLK